MIDIKCIADKADMIINGYAFTKCNEGYQVLNLNKPNSAVVLSISGDVIETSMDDIEIEIVKDYYKKNRELMEE